MTVHFDRLPHSIAILIVGFSNVTAPTQMLPMGLAAYGMPGCDLRVSVDATAVIAGAGGAATFNLAIPTMLGLVDSTFHVQALVPDALAANGAGAVMSDAATAVIGP